jgi:hypothetical protein
MVSYTVGISAVACIPSVAVAIAGISAVASSLLFPVETAVPKILSPVVDDALAAVGIPDFLTNLLLLVVSVPAFTSVFAVAGVSAIAGVLAVECRMGDYALA